MLKNNESSKKYRIVVGGIHIESTTFTSYISSRSDFRIKKGNELLESYPWFNNKIYNCELVPLINARAIPGGYVCKEFYGEWLNEFTTLLISEMSKGEIHGVLLDVHGAMSVQGMIDVEGELAHTIREIVGPEVIISTTMDLHGNVSDKLFKASDLLTCYRTAPHIDTNETRQRAFENLLLVLNRSDDKLVKAKIDMPILLPGEKTSTEVEPGKTLYKKIEEVCLNERIIDAAIWMGFPWADQERCHASIVVTGKDESTVRNEIRKLSEYFWQIKDDFKFVGPTSSPDDAIKIALSSEITPYFISDTGDNPGAGGSGDLNIMLRKFLEICNTQNITKRILFSSIFDRKVIDSVYKYKIGEEVKLSLGGNVDPEFAEPLKIKAKVLRFFNGGIAGKCAIIGIDNIEVIVTENRYQYGTLNAYRIAGINEFSEYDIIVVKMGYLEPDLSNGAKDWIMALSNGAVNQDLLNIEYKYIRKPLYPFDQFEFIPSITVLVK
ncbi:hypothetical protein KQ51_01582 [Candidatus Izimaplasma bacterium HR1]|jgi:microcystin degradation protein MlrC|uniref:M81 family metallopeptidase n=1 Tax=Candidatus Izimoplasma sp. HR1 TaxID=1541959 RepID=UPI0004F74760|nr:hypothetical protein KQ51_01582 [Candidatus Izimaplasma bacterium HR1]